MKMLSSKAQLLLVVSGGLFLTIILLSGAKASATTIISAAGTSFPGTGADNYAIVQVTGDRSHSCRITPSPPGSPCPEASRNYNAQTKLKARTTVAAVYVEESYNSQVTLDVPCGPGGNDVWAGYINFRVFGGSPESLVRLGQKAECDGSISFNGGAQELQTMPGVDGKNYKMFILVADGVMAEGGANRERRYMERFRVDVPASLQDDVLVGVSSAAWPCSITAYPISCPTPLRTLYWAGLPEYSWAYSSFYGSPGSEHTHSVDIEVACNTDGILSLYDFDYPEETVTISGGGSTTTIRSEDVGNNGYRDTQDTLLANTSYTISSSSLPAAEAVQILPSATLLGDCDPPDNGDISCTIEGVTVLSASRIEVDVEIGVEDGALVPAGSVNPDGSGTGVHLLVSSAGDPSTWNNRTNFNNVPPDKQDNYTPRSGGKSSNLSYYNFDWPVDNRNYKRYYVNRIERDTFNVSFEVDVSDDSNDIVVRLLDRTDGTFYSYDSNCREPVNLNDPPVFDSDVDISCDVNEGETTAVLTVTYDASDSNGDSITVTATGAIEDSDSTPAVSSGSSSIDGSFEATVDRRVADYSVTIEISDGSETDSQTVTDNCPRPDPPDVSILSTAAATCNSLTFRITDDEGFTYDAELQVNNANANPRVQQDGLSTNPAPASEHVFNEVSEWRDFNSRDFRVRVVNTSFSGVTATSSNIRVGPCLTVSCSDVQLVGVPEPNVALRAEASMNISDTFGTRGSNNNNATITLDAPDSFTNGDGAMLQESDDASAIVPLYPSRGVYRAGIIPTEPGIFTVTVRIAGLNPSPVTCNSSVTISERPFVKFYGNDIYAGGGFSEGCSAEVTTLASARAHGAIGTDASGQFFRGSSSELGIFAGGIIQGIIPGAANPSTPNPGATETINRLAFSNIDNDGNTTLVLNSQTYGSGFQQIICSEDYWATLDGNEAEQTGNSFNITDFNGQETRVIMEPTAGNNTVSITADDLIEDGTRLTFYVNGNVEIDDDIVYENNTWASEDDIPSIIIISHGNIFMNKDVTNLYGVFVAQENDDPDFTANVSGSIGNIISCYDSGAGNLRASILNNNAPNNAARQFLARECRTNLTVTGAFIANKVHLLRTNGTVSDADRGDDYFDTEREKAAEIFRFNPLLYLVGGDGVPNPNNDRSLRYNSILTLPPTF